MDWLGASVPLVWREINVPYTIVKAQLSNNWFVPMILIGIKGDSGRSVRVFLPKRYTSVFTDNDILRINEGEIKLNVVYHGRFEKSTTFSLSLAGAII